MTSSVPTTLSIAALVVALTATGCRRRGDADLPPARGAGAPPAAVLPALTESDEATAVAGSDTTGTTYPRARAEVGPPLSGVIASIDVGVGDRVSKNQVLFRLRTTDLVLHVQQAKAGQATARVNLAAVQTEFDRAQRLFDKQALEQSSLDRVRAQLDAAKAMVAQADVGVRAAQQVMADATVRSPIDGFVTYKLKNAGEMATMMPPTVVLVIEDHSALELKFRVAEAALATIKEGDALTASFAAVGVTREATIKRIAPSVDPMTRTVEVSALLDNADGKLRSGMLASVARPSPPATPAPAPSELEPGPVEAKAAIDAAK